MKSKSKFGQLLEHYYQRRDIQNQTELYHLLEKKYTKPTINKYLHGRLVPSHEFIRDIEIRLTLSKKEVKMLWLAHGLDIFLDYAKGYGGEDVL